VNIAFGTDAAVFPHGDNAKEFAVYVKLGMSPIDAIRTATVNAVDLLGVEDRGIITEGRLADIIAVKGNPLDDITVLEDVQFVMHGGRIVKK
jgi:imidazolonepropionase-like amidohydrolase